MSSHPILNLCISIMDSCTLFPLWCFSNPKTVTITKEFFYHFSTYTYDGAKWPSLNSYRNFFPCSMRKMDVMTSMPICCFHTHFLNLHIDGCAAYQLTVCTHLSNFLISLKTISYWSRPSWPKTATTLEGSTWVAYGFLTALPCFKLWRAK